MKKIKLIKSFAWAALTFVLLLSACQQKETNTSAAAGAKEPTYYTCPMHPQIVQDKPGTCPICGMDLVPFQKNLAQDFLTLDPRQRALANVTTITLGENGFSGYKQLNGRLVIDPEKTEYVSSKVPGRIEKLYVRQTGEKVNKGQPLYQIYSEQLATLQQEYLLALEQARQFPADAVFKQLLAGAEQKLILYGQSRQQINRLQVNKKTDPLVTYTAPESGTVAELSITEGQYVAEGSPILRLESYGNLWVEADIYASEAGSVKEGQKLKVVIPGWESAPQTMTISFITPVLQSGSQMMQIRGTIPNPNGQWQAGLQASVFLPLTTAHSKVLSLPVDAVIRNGKGTHVWVETGKGKFESRMVKTGLENANQVEILEGLKAGDAVVITGAYLLYSEYVLKKGKDPMAGMKM
ncbi:MAG TPA: efflux RND transporter periplasmic adaptor subunit [Daejeonella sp.]|nr:efflux RND transporter periplasmic adaptor subunit [Daejeonella sp.]